MGRPITRLLGTLVRTPFPRGSELVISFFGVLVLGGGVIGTAGGFGAAVFRSGAVGFSGCGTSPRSRISISSSGLAGMMNLVWHSMQRFFKPMCFSAALITVEQTGQGILILASC
jgi:hypothetical protein